jgi:hypothetical protein
MIDLLDTVILEICEESFKCWFGFGYEDTSARISIDTVDERRPKGEAIILPCKIILNLVDQIGFCGLVIS